MERKAAVRENLLVKLEAENGASDSSITVVLIFSILVASCGSLLSGCGMGYTSPVESQLMSDLDLFNSWTVQFSLFGSLTTAGGLLGSIMSGNITEYLDMGITALCSLVGWIAIAFSEAVWSLYVGRLLVGVGMGLISYVVPIYAAEITPKNLRGGAVLAFMVKVGREKEYVASLQHLRGDNVDISLEAAEIKEYTEALENMHESNFPALFRRKYAYALTIGLGLMALGQFSGVTGLISYVDEIFKSAGFSTTVGTIAVAIIQVPVTSVGVILMDRLGRRPLLLISASGMCLPCIFSGLSFLFKDHGWLTSISPSLVFVGILIIALPFIPDSPRWLMKVGRVKEYVASLQRLRGENVDISLEAAEIKEYTEAHENMHESSFLALFQRKYAYALTIGLGLMALGQFSWVMGVICYVDELLSSAGFSTAVGTISIAIIQIPVTSVGVILMDKVGRRPLILISASGMCLGCILSGLSFLFKDHGWLTSISPSLAFVGILLLVAAYPMGMGGIPFIIMSEVFPMNVKGTAGSLATSVNWATSWIVSYAFNFILDWSSAGTFFLFAFINAFTCLFVFKLVPETKGRMLEEIQESMTHALN